LNYTRAASFYETPASPGNERSAAAAGFLDSTAVRCHEVSMHAIVISAS